jgi:hypothetical protein
MERARRRSARASLVSGFAEADPQPVHDLSRPHIWSFFLPLGRGGYLVKSRSGSLGFSGIHEMYHSLRSCILFLSREILLVNKAVTDRTQKTAASGPSTKQPSARIVTQWSPGASPAGDCGDDGVTICPASRLAASTSIYIVYYLIGKDLHGEGLLGMRRA